MADTLGNIQSLIDAANRTTGREDRDMTAAAKSLMAGFCGSYPGDTTLEEFLTNGRRIINHTATELRPAVFSNDHDAGLLTEARFYALEKIPSFCFRLNRELSTVDFPVCREIGQEGLEYCAMPRVELPRVEKIGNYAFYDVTELETLILRGATAAQLQGPAGEVFHETKIIAGLGYVYVPGRLVEQYRKATNWMAIAAQIRAIEDYPEITGGGK